MAEPEATPGIPSPPTLFQAGGEMGRLLRAKDWSRTPLGPIESWPQSLRTAVNLCLASNFPILLAWGPGYVQIYNDGYWPLCGDKHPQSLGQDFRECWASAWPAIGPAFETARNGTTAFLEDQRMFLDRLGYLEEAFFTFSISPIRDETEAVVGLLNPVIETTGKMLGQRRTLALRDLAANVPMPQSLEEGIASVARILEGSDLDIPFALFYQVDPDGRSATLSGQAGLAPGGPASPLRIDLAEDAGSWPLRQAYMSRVPIHLDDIGARFPGLACGPYPEPLRSAVLLPIIPAGFDRPACILVAGASTRLPMNETYRAFYALLGEAVAGVAAKGIALAQARQRVEALAEIDRAKTAFFSNVSHEFRTPLTLMLGPLEDELADPADALPPRRRERIETAQRNALRLLKLVNTMLDFSRMEAGRAVAAFRPTDLAAFTAGLASNFRSLLGKAGLSLDIDCPPSPVETYVDRDMWEKIVLNLLSNASKHTFRGGVRVSLRSGEAGAELRVEDTGIGIPASELPHVFERFHRVQGARSRSHEGTGIGLALVKELAEAHGGTVSVSSREGVGSVFTVALKPGHAHLPSASIRPGGPDGAYADSFSHAEAYLEEARDWMGAPDGEGGAPSPAARPAPLAGPPVLPQAGPAPTRESDGDGRRPRILWADDNADMREYVRRILAESYDVRAVADGLAALESARSQPPDLVLTDIMMPGLDGFGLLRALKADPATRAIPVILLSARAGEEAALGGLEAGADDYLVKPFSSRELAARVRVHLDMAAARREWVRGLEAKVGERTSELARANLGLREAEERVRTAQARLQLALDAGGVGIMEWDPATRTASWDERVYALWGLPPGTPVDDQVIVKGIHPEDGDRVRTAWERSMDPLGDGKLDIQFRVVDAGSGAERWIQMAGQMDHRDGKPARYVGTVLDVTERRRRDERSRQNEKLAALGQLVGGIAHDFNNQLAGILGYSELLLERLTDPEQRRFASAILLAAERSGDLTRSLLTFSRQDRRKDVPIDVHALVQETISLLERSLEKGIRVKSRLHARSAAILGDPAQIQNALLNLALNARDAMPKGGFLEFSTRIVEIDPEGHPEAVPEGCGELRPGSYLETAVTDTGEGMSDAVQRRIFEPFFTTKPTGKGTGMGLASVFGTVQSHHGAISMESRVGRGTSFRIYLPLEASRARPGAGAAGPAGGAPAGPGLRVLVVDDEPVVLRFLTDMLRSAGHIVLSSQSGEEAINSFRRTWKDIDLVILDVMMAGLGGRETLRELRRMNPNVKVLVSSGAGPDGEARAMLDEGASGLLQKPYQRSELEARIAEVAATARALR